MEFLSSSRQVSMILIELLLEERNRPAALEGKGAETNPFLAKVHQNLFPRSAPDGRFC